MDIGGPTHYYGDQVRRLFLISSFIMVAALPFVHRDIPQPLIFSIIAILVLAVAAGATNPVQRWTAIVNVAISLAAVVGFEYYAIYAYNAYSVASAFFWASQALALILLIAAYYSVKTLRGEVVR